MTASRPWTQWFVVPTPRRPVGLAASKAVRPGCHCGRRIGDVSQGSQVIAGGAGSSNGDGPRRVLLADNHLGSGLGLLERGFEVTDPARHLAHELV